MPAFHVTGQILETTWEPRKASQKLYGIMAVGC
jgi:hypothetical protein